MKIHMFLLIQENEVTKVGDVYKMTWDRNDYEFVICTLIVICLIK